MQTDLLMHTPPPGGAPGTRGNPHGSGSLLEGIIKFPDEHEYHTKADTQVGWNISSQHPCNPDIWIHPSPASALSSADSSKAELVALPGKPSHICWPHLQQAVSCCAQPCPPYTRVRHRACCPSSTHCSYITWLGPHTHCCPHSWGKGENYTSSVRLLKANSPPQWRTKTWQVPGARTCSLGYNLYRIHQPQISSHPGSSHFALFHLTERGWNAHRQQQNTLNPEYRGWVELREGQRMMGRAVFLVVQITPKTTGFPAITRRAHSHKPLSPIKGVWPLSTHHLPYQNDSSVVSGGWTALSEVFACVLSLKVACSSDSSANMTLQGELCAWKIPLQEHRKPTGIFPAVSTSCKTVLWVSGFECAYLYYQK